MKTIWKFDLNIVDEQHIRMPDGARLLSVQNQHGFIALWALVDDDVEDNERRLFIRGTGHPIDAAVNAVFVGTVIVGAYVWHIFDGGWV